MTRMQKIAILAIILINGSILGYAIKNFLEAAKFNAKAAKFNAETAKFNAETARIKAETARITAGKVTFKCYAGQTATALPGCKVEALSLGRQCAGNTPYGVCSISSLPVGKLRFRATMPSYKTGELTVTLTSGLPHRAAVIRLQKK